MCLTSSEPQYCLPQVAAGALASNTQNKFAATGSITMEFGGLETFYGGLEVVMILPSNDNARRNAHASHTDSVQTGHCTIALLTMLSVDRTVIQL